MHREDYDTEGENPVIIKGGLVHTEGEEDGLYPN